MADPSFPIGTKIRHRQSGVTGTIVGRAIPARSAGNRLMQRVRWDTPFRQHPDGSATFTHLLEAV